jgi:hypothetical protein
MAYLVDHPPARRQFRSPRRAKPSGGIAIHTAENTPDTLGPDAGAENVAAFIARRSDPGSYHDLCDSDTIVQLVRYTDEAYHDGTGSNPFSLSVSGATQASRWDQLDDEYVESMTRNMARAAARQAAWLKTTYGIVVPARWISAADYRNHKPGFVRHADLDPSRRSDPGTRFPDELFFDTYAALMAGATPDQEDFMATADEFLKVLKDPRVRYELTAIDAEGFRDGPTTRREIRELVGLGVKEAYLGASGPRVDQAIQSLYLWAKAEAEAGNPRALAALAAIDVEEG